MKKKFSGLCFIALVQGLAFGSGAELSVLRLTLSDVEKATIETSPVLRVAEQEYQAAYRRSTAQRAFLSPKLSLEASYRYQTEVPEFQPVRNGPFIQMGDYPNYSIGPQVFWTVFASGSVYQRWRAAEAAAKAAAQARDGARRQMELTARMAYFEMRLGLEQVRLLSDSLKLEASQYRDIHLKREAGAASRIDELSSHQQLLNRRRALRQAQADLAKSLRSLHAVTGLLTGVDVTVPTDVSAILQEPMEKPTVVLEGDSLDHLNHVMKADAPREFDADHPQLLSLTEAISSARRTAEALRGGFGPTVQVMAKISRDYPNGPVLESFTQNTIGVAASWPLFEGGRTPSETKSQAATINAAVERREQTERDLRRDFDSAHDRLQALRFEERINRTAVEENETLSRLVYDAYRAGRSTYLEVENANLRLLQAREQAARTQVEILMQVAVLDSLAKPLPTKESHP